MVATEIQRLSRFPFLKTASEFMAAQNISLGEIMEDRTYEQARAEGMARLLAALRYRRIDPPAASGYADYLNDIISYVVARITASAVGDGLLINWYAAAEAARAANLLLAEEKDFVADVALELGFCLEDTELYPGTTGQGTAGMRPGEPVDFHVRLSDYLAYAPRLKSKEWKLVNQALRHGMVPLSRERAVRLLREVLAEKFERELNAMKVDRAIARSFRSQIIDLRNRMAEIRNIMEQQSFTELDISRIPPCIAYILAMTKAGQNVSHIARFAMTSFLLHIGMKPHAILELFRTSPDFREDLARYQVEHIAGEISGTEYSPLSCDSMRTNGICYNNDALCSRIRHPLSYYEQRMEDRRPLEERRLREACSTAAAVARYQNLSDSKAASLRKDLMNLMKKCVFSVEAPPPLLQQIPVSISPGKVVALRFRVDRAWHSSVSFRHPSRPEEIYTVYTFAILEGPRGRAVNTTNILDWNLGSRLKEGEGQYITLVGQFLPLDERRKLFHVVTVKGDPGPVENGGGKSE